MGTFQGCRLTPWHKPDRSAFTLIELLVVIAIICLLAALLVPALQNVRANSESAACVSNLRQLVMAATSYEADHDGEMPYPGGLSNGWLYVLPPYLEIKTPYQMESDKDAKRKSVLTCPTQFNSKPCYRTYGMNLRLVKGEGNPNGLLPTTRMRALRGGHPNNVMPVSASTIPYFLCGHIWDYSGEFRDWRTQDADIPEETWKLAFPHDEGCNIAYLDGHVARTKRGEGILSDKTLRYQDNEKAF